MKAKFIAVYKIHGANRLPNGAERVPLVRLDNPTLAAVLTTNPEPDFIHIDKSLALGAQLLKGLFAPDKEGTLDDRLATEIQDVKGRRAKRTEKGVFRS